MNALALMQSLEVLEENTRHIKTAEWHMPMITCEEPVDVSYLEGPRVAAISDAIACTNVGEVRRHFDGTIEALSCCRVV